MITITIVYFTNKIQHVKKIKLNIGTPVHEALKILQINIKKNNKIGIYGELVSLNHILNNKDRLEIYRPLKINPRELRKQKINRKLK
ncbi:hypothetical protein bbp_234 [Buchnera aphidicola str. Bp (Baizongia pistaciae)]|uniref:UPF0125 protein bbp_234 n=1 Tax=Buchnera aphidicola subsp. Baizongia pistaciae (strain Bp) TaxID=224915 RepID=Y234_BUCBP|nr:RnfH family protein [Buchnera aphidicola]Q89AN0.1 RecName: Full=UPF0125 protein bbp_234 [Buchnera aphidicola str. Bp (Baizongia pistaciae)]AAO26961.1 hypothetical protein bbp_234 [Buchnera aphidicola str. Bp (Baizongia pistaciae)]